MCRLAIHRPIATPDGPRHRSSTSSLVPWRPPPTLQARPCPGKRRCNRSSNPSKGPVAKIIAVIIIIITGLTLAFGDTSGGARRLIQIVFGLSIAFAASSFFLSFFSFGGGVARLMMGGAQSFDIPGFIGPVHRALTEPILLGGAPRALAIANGTLAGGRSVSACASGWSVIVIWAIGHGLAAVWAAKRDPLFVDVVRRHLRIPGHLSV
jgi:type IV secretory pathway TrbD component